MPESILTLGLEVSYLRSPQGSEEGLVYKHVPLAGMGVPRPQFALVPNWPALQNQIETLRLRVKDLITKAIAGAGRGPELLEPEARRLAQRVLPPRGFVGIMRPGVHPHFHIADDYASPVPWEALQEHYFRCRRCGGVSVPIPMPPEGKPVTSSIQITPPQCQRDGSVMELVTSRLSLTYHPTHLVYGEGSSSGGGREFLFIEDPKGDLCREDKDPDGVCRSHLNQLRSLMERRGFDLNILSGPNANNQQVRRAIAGANLAGIYYFGHGFFPLGGAYGCLELADGPLFANEIEEIGPTPSFAFINACEGAATGGNWSLERKCRSVAEAFAQGGRGKVVIAPLFPVVNVQAAASALEFFQKADQSACLGEALQTARAASLDRYESGKPDTSWLAYRYFGDPNKRLPVPMDRVVVAADPQQVPPCRVFTGEGGQLNTEVFAFAVDDVLLRAAKRRNLQNRAHVTVTDLTAGLIRKGDLTRFLLRREQINPDELYEVFGTVTERGAEAPPADAPPDAESAEATAEQKAVAELRKLLARWIVHDRAQFTDEVIDVLTQADNRAQRRPPEIEDRRISEQDVLESLLADGCWCSETIPGLLTATRMQALIEECHRAAEVDENGLIDRSFLDPSARKVIDTVHRLAQQRGVYPVTNRLTLAALLANQSGYGARVCRAAGVDPGKLFLLMIAASEEHASQSFGLSTEACSRAIAPVIEAAKRMAADASAVTERDLFKAFCQVADIKFKEALHKPPLGANFDQMQSMEPASEGEKPEDPPVAEMAGPPTARNEGVSQLEFEDDVWRILLESAQLARLQGWGVIRSPHLFAAMIGDESTCVGTALRENNVNPEELKRLVLSLVPPHVLPVGTHETPTLSPNVHRILRRATSLAASGSRAKATQEDLCRCFFEDGGGVVGELLRQVGIAVPPAIDATRPSPAAGQRPSVLAALGVDFTERARKGELPDIVARDREIDTALQTLLLTENANPLLVGEAGVGKTAVVEGLAQRIVRGRCPEKLRNVRIVELSAGGLVANTRLRGEFEQRIKEVLVEARGNVILFIDEIHTIVGAGLGEGGGPDASNMLKAALARGEIRLIGATTFSEYKRTIERDKALSRRFQVQMIAPPSREATVRVLSARQPFLEEHHGVVITDEAKAAAVDLSGRYIVDKQWPAKARDVLERACVVAVTEAVGDAGPVQVRSEHVTRVVANQTGIPVERVSASEEAALATLDGRLAARIVGQASAIHTVGDAIRRGRKGLAGANRPWGVFLFVGPTGVGKTELAKVIAEEVYGGPDGLIRFDMGDFTEPHSKAKLIGAPPGYVGYDQGAPLAERLRRHPYSLLLFDEIEHAHPDVLAVLLRLLSEGMMEGADGVMADARNAIVILTSNALGDVAEGIGLGFVRGPRSGHTVSSQLALRAQLERILPAKIIDRIDAVVPFHCLAPDDLKKIIELRAGEVFSRVSLLYGLTVEVDPGVWPWLAVRSASESSGARSIQRCVDTDVAAPLSEFLSHLEARNCKRAKLSVMNDVIQVQAVEAGT